MKYRWTLPGALALGLAPAQACAPVASFLAGQAGPRIVAERLEGAVAADAARRLFRAVPDVVLVIPTHGREGVLAFVHRGKVCSHVRMVPVARFLEWVRGVKV